MICVWYDRLGAAFFHHYHHHSTNIHSIVNTWAVLMQRFQWIRIIGNAFSMRTEYSYINCWQTIFCFLHSLSIWYAHAIRFVYFEDLFGILTLFMAIIESITEISFCDDRSKRLKMAKNVPLRRFSYELRLHSREMAFTIGNRQRSSHCYRLYQTHTIPSHVSANFVF